MAGCISFYRISFLSSLGNEISVFISCKIKHSGLIMSFQKINHSLLHACATNLISLPVFRWTGFERE